VLAFDEGPGGAAREPNDRSLFVKRARSAAAIASPISLIFAFCRARPLGGSVSKEVLAFDSGRNDDFGLRSTVRQRKRAEVCMVPGQAGERAEISKASDRNQNCTHHRCVDQ
jgi:hypothetical protein